MLKDRSVGVYVDRGDILRLRNSNHMLARARDADSEIQIRRDLLAGLPDLPRWRHPTGIARRARGSHLRAHQFGQWLEFGSERFWAADAAPAGDDDARFFEPRLTLLFALT